MLLCCQVPYPYEAMLSQEVIEQLETLGLLDSKDPPYVHQGFFKLANALWERVVKQLDSIQAEWSAGTGASSQDFLSLFALW